MSNMPSLRTIHRGGAHPCRPRHTWRGYRPPRSARRQWEDMVAWLRYQKTHKVVELPGQQDPWLTCEEPACAVARSTGFTPTPWQHQLMHDMNKEEAHA